MYYTDIFIRKFEDWVLYYFIHFTYHIYLFLSNFQLSIFIIVKFAQYVYVLIFMLHKLTHFDHVDTIVFFANFEKVWSEKKSDS